MANWKTIDELRNIFIEKYTTSKLSTELEKACSEEYELMRDYNGRQILELLQNVDDACGEKTGSESAVTIKFVDGILEVGNTGTTFTEDTIERLCLGRASNKSASKIGNKGTGFRSLLNDAEWIEIHSGTFSIRFSYEYTKSLFEQYVNKESACYCELIANQLDNWKKDYPLCFPVLNCPKAIEKVDTKFDTLIRIKIKETNQPKTTSIDSQLRMSFYKSILFLPNITKIVIETNESKRQYEKRVGARSKCDYVLIQDNLAKVEEYYLFKKQVNILEEKQADLMIAYPINTEHDISKEKLYCFFPIRNFQAPIHALIHAPFVTNNSRDDVPNDNEQINFKILSEVAIFIKEVAEILKDLDGANPIEFVTPFNIDTNKMWDSDFFNLKKFYLELLCDSRIIPTVNDEYISINDGPKILPQDFPDEFSGEGFEKLVKKINSHGITDFIRRICQEKGVNYSFTAEELAKAIDIHNSEYSIGSASRIFLWWSKFYRDSSVLPKVLKDTNDKWIQKEYKVFLPTNDGISILPQSLAWVKLCVLKQEYVTELIEIIKVEDATGWTSTATKYSADRTNEKRLLDAYSDLKLALELTEQSSSRVIVSEIVNQVDSIDKAVLFINWFYENYKDKMNVDSELAKLRFRLPDRDNNLQDTKKLFFGIENGNALADKLFSNTDYLPLCNLDEIYKGNEKEGFKEFLRICGVLTYPQCKKINMGGMKNDWPAFGELVKQKYNFNLSINYIETFTIDNFRELLEELTTGEIVELLSNDLSLSSMILSTEKQSTVKQQINWYPSYFNSNEYVLYVLNTSKWIEIEGKRYSPKDIIKYGKLKNKLNSIYGIQERDMINILSEDIVKRYNLEFKEDFSEFSDEVIFDILKQLPDFDNGEISRKLYLDVINGKRDVKPKYKPDCIRLIAKDGKFHDNSKLFYIDKTIPQTVENWKKVDIPIQKSAETIRNWFGVETFKLNLRMMSYMPITGFEKYDEEIKSLKVCILSVLDDVSPNYINKLRRLQVIPCHEIKANDNELSSPIEINDYSFIKDNGKFYFKLPSSEIEVARNRHEYAMAFVEMFKEAVSPQISVDLAELLICKNNEDRRRIIEEKYGIDKWNTSYEALFERSSLLKMIEEFFKANKLNNELFCQISNIDFSSNLPDEDISLLIKCLESIDKDVCDINSIHGTINIDIRNYIKKQYLTRLSSFRNIYKSCVYSSLVNFSDKQQSYLALIEAFDNYDFEDVEIENSIHYSVKDALIKKFPVLDCDIQNIIDVNGIYNTHYADCISREGIVKADFEYFIEMSKEEKSLLYFNSYEKVIQDYLTYIDNHNSNISSVNYEDEISKDETSTITTELIANDSLSGERKKGNYSGEFGRKRSREISDSNELAGEMAEKIAFTELKKNYPDLIWNSKYSTIPEDRNNQPPNNIVCDMWNPSDAGNTYFEVKSSISEFEMSLNEYESMKKNKAVYYVVLVNRETKEISKHLFDELEQFKVPVGYKFSFKQSKVEK